MRADGLISPASSRRGSVKKTDNTSKHPPVICRNILDHDDPDIGSKQHLSGVCQLSSQEAGSVENHTSIHARPNTHIMTINS